MLTALLVILRSIGLICRGHRAVALENLALRQQLAALKRTVNRPQLSTGDRLFWILLAKGWREWRSALVVVQPDTVVRWHRQWLRRQWTWRSTRTRPGRPSTNATVRTLVGKMAAANPLWGAPRIHGELCKLGIAVSERTVSRLLRRRTRPRPGVFRRRRKGAWWRSPRSVDYTIGTSDAQLDAFLASPCCHSFRCERRVQGIRRPSRQPLSFTQQRRFVARKPTTIRLPQDSSTGPRRDG